MSEENVFEGYGIIETKEEAVTKADKKYWKFKINVNYINKNPVAHESKTFSLWEHPAGNDVSVGDKVQIFWTEKPGVGQFGAITYRNLNSIAKVDSKEIKSEEVQPVKDYKKVDEFAVKRANEFLWGQCFNKSCDLLIAKGISLKYLTHFGH